MINDLENDGGTPCVNWFLKKRYSEPDGKFFKTRLRLSGYLAGCFSRGAHYMLWSHEKFSRATRTHKPLTPKHVARVWVEFTKTSQHWKFEKVRKGRSFRWKVTPAGYVRPPAPALSDGEIRARLVGYIRGTAAREGDFRTGELFLQHFCKTTCIPRDRAERALERIEGIEGLKVRKRTVGDRFFLKISLPHFSLSVSSPSGRIKNTETTRARGFASRTSGSPVGSLPRPCGAIGTGLRPGPSLRSGGMAFDGRWISTARLHALACHLATGPLRAAHFDGLLVRWAFPHARNFALDALADGHAVAAIVGAYTAGAMRSHADARDRNEEAQRAPSATVNYARKILKDGLSAEARWRAFFASDPKNIEVRNLGSMREFNSLGAKILATRHAVVNPAENSSVACAAELFEKRRIFLRQQLVKNGFTLKQFRAMPQAMKDKFARAAIEANP